MSPEVAQGRRAARLDKCPLLGEQQACYGNATTSALDPETDMRSERPALLPVQELC